MKTLLIAVLAISLCPILHAEPPAKLEGLANIPFGSSQDQVKAVMESRGAIFRPNTSTSTQLQFEGGTFNNEAADFWHFYFTGGKLYKSCVVIMPPNRRRMAAFGHVKNVISKKYGQPYQETTVDMDPQQLYDLVSSGKLTLEANWHVEAPSSRSIACKLHKRWNEVVIRIIYQDDAIQAEISAKQKAEQKDDI